MVVNGKPFKRMKRRVTADLYDFLAFPSEGDELSGPFRTNVRSFLSKHARLPPPSSLFSPTSFPHLLTWQILFRVGDLSDGELSRPTPGAVVALDVVEEEVTRSRSVYCDQCRVVGWSGHPVCGKRYHFIIVADTKSIDGYQHACTRCRATLSSNDTRCRTCNNEMTSDDAEDLVYHQLEDSSHLLHGVIHTNGYGHLLRVNGREGGSKFLSGREIIDFWDRLCKTLRVRKVSVMDVSKKFSMDSRLLHAITSGRTWYGNWGYEFGAGSFALTLGAYQTAIKELSDILLASLLSDGNDGFSMDSRLLHAITSGRTWYGNWGYEFGAGSFALTLGAYQTAIKELSDILLASLLSDGNDGQPPPARLLDVIACYLSLSGHRLATVKDLFCFILQLLQDSHKQGKDGKASRGYEMPLSLWSDNDVKRAEWAMIKVLKAINGSHWVTWKALRGAAFRAGPPKLLDYCLKELAGRVIDSKIVDVRRNPETDVIEYRLCDESRASQRPMSSAKQDRPSGGQLLRDLRFLYDALLNPHTMQDIRPNFISENVYNSAVRLLDCKQFVKDYGASKISCSPKSGTIHALCEVELIDQPKDCMAPPPELVVLPESANVGDLKCEASRAFQDVYVMFKRLHVEELIDYNHILDSASAAVLVGVGGLVRVRGRCHYNHGLYRFRMERGTENWTVDCICGAKDDDGERMMACDKCGVWHHTRCDGISDCEAVPIKFVCVNCGGPPTSAVVGATAPGSGQRCRGENYTGKSPISTVTTPKPPFTVG